MLSGVGGSLLSACGGTNGTNGGTPAARSDASATLTVASTGGFQGLDVTNPAVIANGPSMELVQALNGTLVSVSIPADFEAAKAAAAEGKINGVPWLAEKWDTSADGKTWRFTLRAGAKSQWGNEFSTDDVLWTVQRDLSEKTLVTAFLLGLGGITDPKQVTAVDERTIEMALPAAPPPFFLQMLATAWMSIYDSVEAAKHTTATDKWASKWLMTNAAGFGPYQLDSGVANKTASLSPNPGFWGEKAPYKKLIQQGVDEQGARLQLVLTNDAQYAGELTPLQLEQARKGKVNVSKFTTSRIAFLVLDARVKPFDDPKVRQAIARAIPYDEILKTVYRGFAQPWRSAFPPWYQGSTDEFWDYETDSAAAKSVLETVGGEPLKLYYYKNYGSGEQISVIVQQALNEAGLNVELEGLLQAVAEKRKLAGELPFFVDDADSPSIPHPLYALNLMYTSTAFQNMAHYSNKEIDAIAAKLAQTPEIEAQNTLVKQANEILMNDLPYVPIAYTGTAGINQKSLTGIGGQLTSLVDYGRFRPA